jgi:nucleotide-binding universal stress UspA family protein
MLDRFHSVVVGVDGTEESFGALEQARCLLAPGGTLTAVIVCEERLAVHAGFGAPRAAAQLHAAASDAAVRAGELLADLPRAASRLVHGRPTECLLAEAAELEADLIAVGSHEHSRSAAIVLGSVASEILHRAPQSVLVARPRGDGPASIVVGVDGSSASLAALGIARELASAVGEELRVVAAQGGKTLDVDALADVAELEWDPAHPVAALAGGAHEARLVVVGSRGRHGLAALGSVSERVAHRARSSVLVVRGAAVAGAAAAARASGPRALPAR